MNQISFENRFFEASFTLADALFTTHWLPSTYEMTHEEYKYTFMECARFIEEYKVQRWMGHTKDFAFIVTPELQSWTAGEFNQRLVNAGLRKMAMIIPTDYIAHLAVQQSVGEMDRTREDETFEIRYFDDPVKAEKWLLNE